MKSVSKHNRQFAPTDRPGLLRAGFTLVEMMVAVALVVLMMMMFVTVFQMATESFGTQRGIAENDQRARTLVTLMRADLHQRTPRGRDINNDGVIDGLDPYDANEIRVEFGRTDGYFYVSENRPEDDTDDLLQFTVRIDPSVREPFFGKASNVPGAGRNQPEWDDGDFGNKSGTSTSAEVAYFLRNGNLYRRVVLIRKPLVGGSGQPGAPLTSGNFYGGFDYSASYNPNTGAMQFHDETWLNNDPLQSLTESLGLSNRRFGFNHDDGTGNAGKSREYETAAAAKFFGRFTHEETSNFNFTYPVDAANREMSQDGPKPAVFADGPRRGEDILMTEVHSFDVKLWDASATPPGYIDADFDSGHPNDPGFFTTSTKTITVPAQAIRITIRYFDVTSEQFRQLTIDKSLLD